MESYFSPSSNTSSTSERSRLTVKDSCTDSGTLFGIQEVYSSGGNCLSHGKPIQLHQEGLWLQRGEYDDELGAYLCMGSKDKSQAFNFLINRYVENIERKRDFTNTTTTTTSNSSLSSSISTSSHDTNNNNNNLNNGGGGGNTNTPNSNNNNSNVGGSNTNNNINDMYSKSTIE